MYNLLSQPYPRNLTLVIALANAITPVAAPPVTDPVDHATYIRCVEDTIRMLRNHPSLLLWCGGNTQRPSPCLPLVELRGGSLFGQQFFAEYIGFISCVQIQLEVSFPRVLLLFSSGG